MKDFVTYKKIVHLFVLPILLNFWGSLTKCSNLHKIFCVNKFVELHCALWKPAPQIR